MSELLDQLAGPQHFLVVVFTQAEGEEGYAIGSVKIDSKVLGVDSVLPLATDATLDQILSALWEEWREKVPQPDADSDFIDWLVENKAGFSRPEMEVTYAKINV